MEEVDAPGNMGNPTANQYGGRASGTKRVRKGKGTASSSFQGQTDYDVILRESVKTQQMVDDERRERHAYFVKLEEEEKEYKIMPMNTTSFTPETKAY